MNKPDVLPGMLLTFLDEGWIFATMDIGDENLAEIPPGTLTLSLTSRRAGTGNVDCAYVLTPVKVGWIVLYIKGNVCYDFDVVWRPT